MNDIKKPNRFEYTNRVIKVFIDEKHVKSFPLIFTGLVDKIGFEKIKLMPSKRKSITQDDIVFLGMKVYKQLCLPFLHELLKNEKYVYELVEDKEILGTRKVESKYNPRYEMVFYNGVKLKVSMLLYKFCPNKLPTVNLNY